MCSYVCTWMQCRRLYTVLRCICVCVCSAHGPVTHINCNCWNFVFFPFIAGAIYFVFPPVSMVTTRKHTRKGNGFTESENSPLAFVKHAHKKYIQRWNELYKYDIDLIFIPNPTCIRMQFYSDKMDDFLLEKKTTTVFLAEFYKFISIKFFASFSIQINRIESKLFYYSYSKMGTKFQKNTRSFLSNVFVHILFIKLISLLNLL